MSSWLPWWIAAAGICLMAALVAFRTRRLPRWFGYLSGASAAIFILGIAVLTLRSALWIVAPVGMVFLLWLVATAAVLAQTIRKFSRPPDNQEPHSEP